MARSGNRDVAADLARALGRHGVSAPLFLEHTSGRHDDVRMAASRENQEALFGVAMLSRWPIAEARIVELPSPERIQFDVERMTGRHVALVATIERPGAPFVAVRPTSRSTARACTAPRRCTCWRARCAARPAP